MSRWGGNQLDLWLNQVVHLHLSRKAHRSPSWIEGERSQSNGRFTGSKVSQGVHRGVTVRERGGYGQAAGEVGSEEGKWEQEAKPLEEASRDQIEAGYSWNAPHRESIACWTFNQENRAELEPIEYIPDRKETFCSPITIHKSSLDSPRSPGSFSTHQHRLTQGLFHSATGRKRAFDSMKEDTGYDTPKLCLLKMATKWR